jgi:hypothetical protein
MTAEHAAELPSSEAALPQLSDALRHVVSTWATKRHEQWQRAIARICVQAHAREGPERMLVVMAAWGYIVESHGVDPDRAGSAFDPVLNYCPKAYYAMPSS